MKPRYTHDCSHCTFLGVHGACDLYHCAIHGFPTVVARFGSARTDVTATTADQARCSGFDAMLEAYRRAFERRLPLAPAA